MAKVTETCEPTKRPTCPDCGDARIGLLKAPDIHGRNRWWLTCRACGRMWQVTESLPFEAAATGK